MTFHDFPDAPTADSVTQAQALPTNQPVVLQPGQTGGVTVNVTVDMASGSVITTVVDAQGNVETIEDITAVVLNGTENITIFFANAPIGTATVDIQAISTILSNTGKDSNTVNAIIDLLETYGSQSSLLNISSFALGDSNPTSNFITYTETFKTSGANLSQGDDAHVSTVLGNTIYGNNGDDLFIITPSGTRNAGSKAGRISFIDMGEGQDTLAITKGALKEKNSKVRLSDFSSKEDQVALDASKRQVKGIGTKKLTISTGKSKFTITTDEGKFRKGDIEFT